MMYKVECSKSKHHGFHLAGEACPLCPAVDAPPYVISGGDGMPWDVFSGHRVVIVSGRLAGYPTSGDAGGRPLEMLPGNVIVMPDETQKAPRSS